MESGTEAQRDRRKQSEAVGSTREAKRSTGISKNNNYETVGRLKRGRKDLDEEAGSSRKAEKHWKETVDKKKTYRKETINVKRI